MTHIGKESNRLDEQQTGVLAHDEALNAYDNTEEIAFRTVVLPTLRALGVREVARRTGLSLAGVHAVLSRGATPRQAARNLYIAALVMPSRKHPS